MSVFDFVICYFKQNPNSEIINDNLFLDNKENLLETSKKVF